MTIQPVPDDLEARCVTCGKPATWALAIGERIEHYCWNHDSGQEFDDVKAAWRRYNSAVNAIFDAFDNNDQPSKAEYDERDAGKRAVESAIREAARRPLVEALEPLRRFLELTVTDRHVAHFHERDGISLNLSYAEWRAIARALISPASEDTNG